MSSSVIIHVTSLFTGYTSGVQLRENNNNTNNSDVLINLSLPNDEIRYQFLEWLYGSIEETKEVARSSAFRESSHL